MLVSPRWDEELVDSKFTFYLGTHIPRFLVQTKVPLFISYRTLRKVKNPRSCTTWAVDSGAFTELSTWGRWITSPGTYAASVRYWWDTVGGLQWCAIQDWMCEPFILAKTGLTVAEHQRRTIDSYLRLKELQPRVPWVAVLQGYEIEEYISHLKQYERAGVNLCTFERVGVGSVCRRQGRDVDKAEQIIRELYNSGLKLHAFGFKTTGLTRCGNLLVSSDSLAWSKVARLQTIRLARCSHRARICANCLEWALEWRTNLLSKMQQSFNP